MKLTLLVCGQVSLFNALDLDDDGVVDHEEWHRCKTAHGLQHGG